MIDLPYPTRSGSVVVCPGHVVTPRSAAGADLVTHSAETVDDLREHCDEFRIEDRIARMRRGYFG